MKSPVGTDKMDIIFINRLTLVGLLLGKRNFKCNLSYLQSPKRILNFISFHEECSIPHAHSNAAWSLVWKSTCHGV